MNPFETYVKYLSIKNHFTKPKYDYKKYCGKVKANIDSFYKRKDRMWFEKISRQKTDEQIVNFFIANFASCENPESLWIGEIIREGENVYRDWSKKNQSLTYIFKEEMEAVLSKYSLDSLFKLNKSSHPQILKEYLQKNISLETLVILNQIFNYKKNFDDKLLDPVWEFVSMRIEKYSSFLDIDIKKFKNILKEFVL